MRRICACGITALQRLSRQDFYFARILVFFILGAFLILFLGSLQPIRKASAVKIGQAEASSHTDAPVSSELPVLLGVYPGGYLGESGAMDKVHDLDAWAKAANGAATSIVAGYYDIEITQPEYTIPGQLNAAWDNGYTPYVSLWTSHHTALEIARGDLDGALNIWASNFAAWANQGTRMAFISILPDMNTNWVTYGQDPVNYQAAYQRIQQIFTQNGVTSNQVRWVFSPYAWASGSYRFEAYFPVNGRVDVLGIDAFQFGYCPDSTSDQWQTIDQLLTPTINRLRMLGDTKPIFVAQLATTAQYPTHQTYDDAKKNQWLSDSYNALSLMLGVRGILYFNVERECDWPIYIKGQTQYDGYRQAIASSRFGYVAPDSLAHADLSVNTQKIHLPTVLQLYQSPDPNAVLLGLYTSSYVGDQNNVDRDLRALDQWSGKHASIGGFFIDIADSNPAYNIPTQFETLWKNGYTGLVNLMTTLTMQELANGVMDGNFHNLAKAYASWLSQPTSPGAQNRRAFIAPFPEMNGYWYTYGQDPTNFILVYRRIVDIFKQEGVPANAVRWVFAPNGYSKMPLEDFYPGDDVVNVVGFSAYNYGYCSAAIPWQQWASPEDIYGMYIERIRVMAPTKPIFITQTGTTALSANGFDVDRKNQWLQDAYNYLANAPSVRAVIYYNILAECDWPVFDSQGTRYDGYKVGVQNPRYRYTTPIDLAQMEFSVDP